jgi:uncharacterized protein YqjF (DUF2071 family)
MNVAGEILSDTANRVYPIPTGKWKYYQEWHDTLFLHWKVPPALLRNYLPKTIELDTIDGCAWVSLLAFEVKKMKMRNLPSFPYVNNFHEINVRTYVIKDGIPGIFMFSVETDKLIQVLMSRLFIGIPYQIANIKRSATELFCENENQGVNLRFSFLNSAVKKSRTDAWLTERHSLYENQNGKLYRFDIHHKEWKLKRLIATINSISYKAGDFSLNSHPDIMHYSKKLPVLLWGKKLLDKENG